MAHRHRFAFAFIVASVASLAFARGNLKELTVPLNFVSGATVKFGGTEATSVTVVSSTQITATTPGHEAGAVDVIVANTDAQSATLSSGFTYDAAAVSGDANAPRSTNNDDTCDVGVYPAATLLLPYFEVAYTAPSTSATNTIFSVVNTSPQPQIVRFQVWTDWSYPVLGFNIFLTGYDVQSISMYDIVSRGVIPATGMSVSPEGPLSYGNVGNPNFFGSVADTCDSLPGPIPGPLLAAVQSALSTGSFPGLLGPVGGSHSGRAIGYVTMDVVATCSSLNPSDPTYYAAELLFDNVLTGDFQLYQPSQGSMTSSPLVHIRAMPEGGPAGNVTGTNLPYTFYDRYTPTLNRTMDRRQPLPGRFAARYIAGGTDLYDTNFMIWREGVTRMSDDPSPNGTMPVQDLVRFDESENPTSMAGSCPVPPCAPPSLFPSTSMVSQSNSASIPPDFSGTSDLGGWIYFNVNNGGSSGYSAPRQSGATLQYVSQNWVVTQTTGQGRFGTAADAAQFGNGCSPDAPLASATNVIAPSANAATADQFPFGSPSTTGNDDSCDISVAPAATLLLPYFEVSQIVNPSLGTDTAISITNVTAQPQIAHVTIWTDWSFPVLGFNIFLTGYDVQSISLYDIISRGVIPATGMSDSPEGPLSYDNISGNPNFLASAAATCGSLPGPIPGPLLAAIQSALTTGVYTGLTGTVGGTHADAVGYVTVDVAATCTERLPNDWTYYTDDILYDNVLIGDYSLINYSSTTGNYSSSSPMVHIRALPEGGKNRETVTNLAFTFYDRYTPPGLRKIDRRQPLPGAFAVRYVDAGEILTTAYVLWREGVDTYDESRARIVSSNASIAGREVVRFDESENPTIFGCSASGCVIHASAAASRRSVSDGSAFPGFSGTSDAGGWMYLNLNNANPRAYSEPRSTGSLLNRSQNWVGVSMVGEGRFGTFHPATQLSNGCSVAPAAGAQIAPGANSTPSTICPAITSCTASVPAVVNEEDVVTFTGGGIAPANANCGLAYEWDFGDSSPVGHTSSSTITHRYTAKGTYIWSVTVRQTDGRSLANGTLCKQTGTITVNPIPTSISAITPTSGTTAGGTAVTITGTNFAFGASVTIGGTAATSVIVVSSTQITATTPAHAAGAVNVVVTNPDAQSATLASGFTYVTVAVSGDADGDGRVTAADVFYLINNLLASGPAAVAGDANGDGEITIGDVFYLINFLFAGGPAPR